MANTEITKQSGFQLMMAQRSAMHNWTHLRTLLNHGSNREAAAIVESFELQMSYEESEFQLKAA
jgi:hypothetical protein